jgi:transposase, IS605 OrfB family, central region
MRKTFRYRIYPTKKQIRIMNQWLEECRWLFNHFLAERKEAWEQEQRSINYHAQATSLPTLKKQRPSLASVHSQVLQNVAVRIDLAFKAFFRRVKAGEKPGYPRFRGKGRYDSFTFPQSGFSLNGNILRLSKIGNVKVVLHRPVEGQIKTCTIKRSSTGKWYVMFSCEWEPAPLPENNEAVGIDVGLHSFATLSTGEQIENPKFFRQEEKVLAKAQRKLSKAEKGTPERKKCRKVVARIHERIAWKRQDFIHQHSRKIVNHFGIIAVEDIQVNRMLHNHCLAKSISDAAWSGFFQLLAIKAEWAGRKFVAVNPAYTSQTCSGCGHRQKMPLSERVFKCPCCGAELDRDVNAALNILGLGRQALGINP